MLRLAVLALCARSSLAFEGSAGKPVPCCFSVSFASNQLPFGLKTEKVDSKDACTLDAPLGGSIGFNKTFCPTSVEEAQCIIQASPIIPTQELSTKKAGPECAFLDAASAQDQQGAQQGSDSDDADDRIPDPPVAPVKEAAKPKTVQPLINSEALRLRPRTLQPHQ